MVTGRARYLFLVLVVVAIGGCRSTPGTREPEPTPQVGSDAVEPPADSRLIRGTVQHIPLEGGFYGIVAEDGRRYDPINLPEAFRQDGLEVACRIRTVPDRASFHMWGQLVEIIEIRRR